MSETRQEKEKAKDVSFEDFVISIRNWLAFFRKKKLTIIIVIFIGALTGLFYSFIVKPTYTAVCTFVLEDSKSGGALGQYAGLASLAGLNLGGGGGGIFEGDNIIELYKSRLMIETALLSEINIEGKKQLLIDKYIEFNDLNSKWKKKDNIDHITFLGNPEKFNRKQDSIITDLVFLFNKNFLTVVKPDKKLNIIRVEVTTKNELFSKFFTEKLVQTVNEFYVKTKTKKASQNIQILQHQADSVKSILNLSINGVASAIDAAPNANPQMLVLKVTSQKKQIDVQANTAIYAEIVKNLELAKISFRQDMPLIQVIDNPVIPLFENRTGKFIAVFTGTIMGFILSIIIVMIKRVFENLRQTEIV